jgi:germination protein M
MSDKKKKNTGFAVACWIFGFIVLLIFFIVKSDAIITNLKNTHFFERLFGKTPTFIQNHPDTENKDEKSQDDSEPVLKIDTGSADDEKTNDEAANQNPVNNTSVKNDSQTADAAVQKKDKAESEKEIETLDETETSSSKTTSGKKDAEENTKSKKQTDTKKNSSELVKTDQTKKVDVPLAYTASFCFIEIDGDGSVNRKIATRQMTKSDAPLSDIVKSLLAGPLYAEQSKGCMTLIPEGTRLLSATVRDGVAYLSFSEEFEFNKVGVEGYLAQLMQIVYTATQFSSVKSVQFLIDGQKKEYLGSEGVWIGSPLTQSTFK